MTGSCGASRRVKTEVFAVLRRFQEGYRHRRDEDVESFCSEIFAPDCEIVIIGTGATHRGGFEWCEGPDGARWIIAEDWRSWGDLIIDTDGAHIASRGNVAWICTVGIVCRDGKGQCTEVAGTAIRPTPYEELPGQLKELAGGDSPGAYTGRTWPVRLSAVLVREPSGWVFHQMHFSYPGLIDV